MFAQDDGDDDDSLPDLEDAEPHMDPRSNPWATAGDPDEDDISNVQFTQTAPGRFNVQATITRSVSPQQYRAGGAVPGPIGGFMQMLNGITRAAAQPQGQPPQGQGAGLFSGPNQNQNQSAFQEARSQGGGGPRVSRFTYTSGGGARMDPANEDMTK